MIITNYGLHEAPGGINFLLQPSGPQNLVVANLEPPFTVTKGMGRPYCLHNVNLGRSEPAPDWIDDPLVQIFLPLPGAGTFVLRNSDQRYDDLLRQLVRLSGSTVEMLRPIDSRLPCRKIYAATNLGPVVWLAYDMSHASKAEQLSYLAKVYDRRVLFVSQGPFPFFGATEVSSPLRDLSDYDLEAIGSGVLKEHMHG